MTAVRNADLSDLAKALQSEHARKIDVVLPAANLASVGGVLHVTGAEPLVEEDGVTAVDGTYRPTVVCDEGISDKLGIPLPYLRRMREERPDLYDANVNGWLHGGPTEADPGDPRSFLLRAFRSDGDMLSGNDGEGVARALLSRNFKRVDNFDVLTAALEGLRDAGVTDPLVSCDLSDRRMYVSVAVPEIAALAPTLLRDYRSPFGPGGIARAGRHAAPNGLGAPGHEYREDVVFAGLIISNSEVGGGAFTITPKLTVLVCLNGLTVTKDALRSVHLGGRLDDGVVRWSDATETKNLELVASMTRDAVSTFLDTAYVEGVIAGIEEKAGTPVSKPAEAIEAVGKALRFPKERTEAVLDFFIRGGQMTAGGVMQAVTACAQTVVDADEAHAMEDAALSALDLAVSFA